METTNQDSGDTSDLGNYSREQVHRFARRWGVSKEEALVKLLNIDGAPQQRPRQVRKEQPPKSEPIVERPPRKTPPAPWLAPTEAEIRMVEEAIRRHQPAQ